MPERSHHLDLTSIFSLISKAISYEHIPDRVYLLTMHETGRVIPSIYGRG